MTDTEYLKQMIAINEKIQNLAENYPTNADEWYHAFDEMHEINNRWYHSRRRRSWIATVTIVVLLCIFAWLIYECLKVLNF